MASFIVTYDTHSNRDYESFYEAMKQKNGIRLAESVWGIRMENTWEEVRDWVQRLLDDDDTIVVIQLKPTLGWATANASGKATDWLSKNAE